MNRIARLAEYCDSGRQFVETSSMPKPADTNGRTDTFQTLGARHLTRLGNLDMPPAVAAIQRYGQLSTVGGVMTVPRREMPAAEPNGWVATLNKMGFMGSWLDPYSQDFVQYCATTRLPVLDIGAAYGLATLPALAIGGQVIANDCDENHLAILKEQTPAADRERLILRPGKIPDEVHIECGALDAVICSRVLHFFTIPDLLKTADAIWRWLSPGGKVFIVEDTPFLANSLSILEEYERRCRAGFLWPGFFEDVRPFRRSRNEWCPPIFHFFDVPTLTGVFQRAGFTVEKCEQFRREDYPADVQLDGREGIGLIACKRS